MYIPSYKYKFKQMFEKIGQVKHYISLVCISANVYFVAVLTRTILDRKKFKSKHFVQSKYSSKIHMKYHRAVQYRYRYIHDRPLSWLGTFTFMAWYIHFPGLVHSLSWLGTFTFLIWYIQFPG